MRTVYMPPPVPRQAPPPVRVVVHAVWFTRHRAPVLSGGLDDWYEAVLADAAGEISTEVLAFGSAADHVHVLLALGPATSVHDALLHLRDALAAACNARRAALSRVAWDASYAAFSVGSSEEIAAMAHVRNQRAQHEAGLPDAW